MEESFTRRSGPFPRFVWSIMLLGLLAGCAHGPRERTQPTVTVRVLEPRQSALPANLVPIIKQPRPEEKPLAEKPLVSSQEETAPSPNPPEAVSATPSAFDGTGEMSPLKPSPLPLAVAPERSAASSEWFPELSFPFEEESIVDVGGATPRSVPRPVSVKPVPGVDPRRLE